MQPARLISFAAAVGNFLQGWDNAAIAGEMLYPSSTFLSSFICFHMVPDVMHVPGTAANARHGDFGSDGQMCTLDAGALLYLKPEFSLDGNPALEGILVASSLIGAWISTLCSGPGADWMGRRNILCISAFLYTVSSCIMLWSPSVPVLILARLLVGGGIGISVTIVPIYIAEIAPAEIRGQLSTFPQFLGSGGLFLSYLLCFCLSLNQAPNWRVMLAILLLPSVVFLLLGIFYLPESPRWLVSKGRMLNAREVLQKLRNRTDVAAELALLVEGLGVGADTSLQEWTIEPADELSSRKSSVRSVLAGPEFEGLSISWRAMPLPDENLQARLSRRGTAEPKQLNSLVDPVVTLIDSLQQVETGRENEEDEPEQQKPDSFPNFSEDRLVGDFDEEQQNAPLLLQSQKSIDSVDNNNLDGPEGIYHHARSFRQSGKTNLNQSFYGSYRDGGWQLGWQWEEPGGKEAGGLKRVFLLQEGGGENITTAGSALSLLAAGESIQAAALVGQSSLNLLPNKKPEDSRVVGPAMLHPVGTAVKGPAWSDLLEGGVRRALVVGVVLQILQQFSGINAVLYYVPQILQQSGGASVLAKAGLGQNSASILGSGMASLLMLPSIVVAMRLMDQTGRRRMLLSTLPLLFISLLMLIISNSVLPGGVLQSAVSLVGVILYVCTFVMGFGPIPNILGSEIFPTRVRGVCIGICQIAMWSCNILLTNMFPTLLLKLGLAGICGCFAVLVVIAWVFTLLKVPETKGMPLEVIIEFFAMSAAASGKRKAT